MIKTKRMSMIVEIVMDVPYIEGKTDVKQACSDILEGIAEENDFAVWDFYLDGSLDGSPEEVE